MISGPVYRVTIDDNSKRINVIVRVVCMFYGIPYTDVRSGVRFKKIAKIRHLIAYFARKYTNYPYKKIGRIIGVTNHATVIYNIKVAEHINKQEIARLIKEEFINQKCV